MHQNINHLTNLSAESALEGKSPEAKSPKVSRLKLFRYPIAAVVIVAGLFVATKPSKTDYDSYIATTFVAELQQAYCSGAGGLTANLCKFSIASGTTIIGDDRLQTLAVNSSVCNSYIVISICSTEIPGKKITKLGILRQFFPLPN